MNDHEKFKAECREEIENQGLDRDLIQFTNEWIMKTAKHKYSYHFEWLGRPIIQFPQDMVGLQQLMWEIQPDLVIETGVARGGSLIFYASILELLATCGGSQRGRVLGIDIDIRQHNREAIESHPMSRRIELIQGSSIAPEVINTVRKLASEYKRILVCLDSNHTHEHVLEELRLYTPLVSKGSYCVVFDTIIADSPEDAFPNRPWTKSANPKSAVSAFLELLKKESLSGADGEKLEFLVDKKIENQLLITVAPGGFLKRV